MRATLQKQKRTRLQRRRWRIRKKLRGTAELPRLAFHKSLRHLYAQLIDDIAGASLLLRSTDSGAQRASGKKTFSNCTEAKALGEKFGAEAKAKGITRVIFDRGGHRYHGVVKAFAEAVKSQGVQL